MTPSEIQNLLLSLLRTILTDLLQVTFTVSHYKTACKISASRLQWFNAKQGRMKEEMKRKIIGTVVPQGRKRKEGKTHFWEVLESPWQQDTLFPVTALQALEVEMVCGTSQREMDSLSQHKSHEEYLCKSSKSSSDRFGALHLGMTPNGTKGWHGGKQRLLLLQIGRHGTKISEMSSTRNKMSGCW